MFDNPQIVDTYGNPFNAVEWDHWLQLPVKHVSDLIDNNGELRRDMYGRFPVKDEQRMFAELELLCKAIPRGWRDYLYQHHVEMEDRSQKKHDDFKQRQHDNQVGLGQKPSKKRVT